MEAEGGSQLFETQRGHEKWAVKRGTVMQLYARDHVEVPPQKKKEVLYLVKKQRKKEQQNIMDINCEVLLQEFNKHLLFIYNDAIESYCIFIMNNVVINVIRVFAILFITVFSITINAGVSILIIIIYVISIDKITFVIIMIFI